MIAEQYRRVLTDERLTRQEKLDVFKAIFGKETARPRNDMEKAVAFGALMLRLYDRTTEIPL